MRQKSESLLKLWANYSSVQLMGGLTGGKSKRICIVQKKVPIF
jgi:hypothetical protein